ncbi:MAG: hypothetical protein CR982_02500 [Candidatus Cloacimonadota bacterium]|nr:MAG: hypothetical protein CR982_02500 [Candidatus Cloacimonadota bacterium]PIE78527.1 MAG: hypothetical protein CSA15_07480 [Candidatus Delongbacteria bacterium]
MVKISTSNTHIKEKKYIFDFIFSNQKYGIEFIDQFSGYTIEFGDIRASFPDYFFKNYYKKIRDISLKTIENLHLFPTEKVPIIFGSEKCEKSENSYFYDIDIIGTIFFILTCYSEISIEKRDRFGRVDYKDTFLGKNNLLHIPIADLYSQYLYNILKIEKSYESRVILTHDIDQLFKFKTPLKTLGGDIIKRKNLNLFLKNLTQYLKVKLQSKRDPWDRFDSYLNLAERYGLDQYFFIIQSNRSIHDKLYSTEDKDFKAIYQKISKSKIGVHYGFESVFSSKIGEERKGLEKTINTKVDCGRSHFLRFDYKTLIKSAIEGGIINDFSLGFSGSWGFRNGTFKPYFGWDHTNDRRSDLIMSPLHIMDTTFTTYGNSSFEETLRYLLNLNSKFGGNLNILLHNSAEIDFSDIVDRVLEEYIVR